MKKKAIQREIWGWTEGLGGTRHSELHLKWFVYFNFYAGDGDPNVIINHRPVFSNSLSDHITHNIMVGCDIPANPGRKARPPRSRQPCQPSLCFLSQEKMFGNGTLLIINLHLRTDSPGRAEAGRGSFKIHKINGMHPTFRSLTGTYKQWLSDFWGVKCAPLPSRSCLSDLIVTVLIVVSFPI